MSICHHGRQMRESWRAGRNSLDSNGDERCREKRNLPMDRLKHRVSDHYHCIGHRFHPGVLSRENNPHLHGGERRAYPNIDIEIYLYIEVQS